MINDNTLEYLTTTLEDRSILELRTIALDYRNNMQGVCIKHLDENKLYADLIYLGDSNKCL